MIEHPQAWKTKDMGGLNYSKAEGFWVLLLVTPYRGRASPCRLLTHSSKTIAASLVSLNPTQFRDLARHIKLVGERPSVSDREFSYKSITEPLWIMTNLRVD
jgi:hypothetical protein